MFCRNVVSLPESRICLGNALLSPIGGGGGEYYSFEVIVYRKPWRGRVWQGVSPSQGGDFLDFGGTKTNLWLGFKV